MPAHEIVSFPATDAFAADPIGVLKTAAEFFATVEGCLGVYAGLAEEEKTGSILIIWETLEHHKALVKRPGYPEILGVKPAINGESKIYHIDFNHSPKAAVTAPTTEVLVLTLKEGKTKEQLDTILAATDPKIIADDGVFGPSAWGATQESEGVVVLLLGWESSKKHLEVIGKPTHTTFVESLKETADTKVVHVSFKKVF
ncbi:hypothetical protein HYPSUDRAFT_187695 [Hypholoma sublateritium FD-334 SS-4]|uniref:ABM domain-containing protein n=1 Tax=Hypholoma sublateritium (strain FD-334 SS-4) TaxID=945553 RepID=A0A0D2L338_HYPSF|nr:hypothetical protein HYPSUDRAFT_187695 [Hypholoma sublateritium FD-334 SS-4]